MKNYIVLTLGDYPITKSKEYTCLQWLLKMLSILTQDEEKRDLASHIDDIMDGIDTCNNIKQVSKKLMTGIIRFIDDPDTIFKIRGYVVYYGYNASPDFLFLKCRIKDHNGTNKLIYVNLSTPDQLKGITLGFKDQNIKFDGDI